MDLSASHRVLQLQTAPGADLAFKVCQACVGTRLKLAIPPLFFLAESLQVSFGLEVAFCQASSPLLLFRNSLQEDWIAKNEKAARLAGVSEQKISACLALADGDKLAFLSWKALTVVGWTLDSVILYTLVVCWYFQLLHSHSAGQLSMCTTGSRAPTTRLGRKGSLMVSTAIWSPGQCWPDIFAPPRPNSNQLCFHGSICNDPLLNNNTFSSHFLDSGC